jgi:hypothetical protein
LSDSQKEELKQNGIKLHPLKVKKISKGWTLEQQGEKRKLKHPKNDKRFYSSFFHLNQKEKQMKQMQCATSVRIIICHIKPLTRVGKSGDEFISHTGYFLIRLHYGTIELTKQVQKWKD